MCLEQQIESLRPLRIFSLPESPEPCCLILASGDLQKLPGWLRGHPGLSIAEIIISDLPDDAPIESNLVINGRKPLIRPGLAALDACRQIPKIFLFASEWVVRIASIAFPWLAAQPVYIVASDDAQFAKRVSAPDFFEKNRLPLKEACSLLKTTDDREAFARRVKAIMTGDSGYLKISPFLEYHHPLAQPENGDTMLDGGLSNMVSAQRIFAEKVGQSGVIHGFEPIPWMAEKAAEELAAFPAYHVHALGLGEKEGEAVFASLGDSSHMGAVSGAETVTCKLCAIDEFTRKNRLEKVDMIKLDVEGAELAALKGGAGVIAEHYPKLVICLYHKPRDLYEIPLYIHEIAPEYDFYLAHSSAGFTDTILYGAKRK